METISVNKVLTETQALMKHAFKVGEIDLVTDFSAFFDTMKGNSNQIKQCCIAILVNAIEACGKEGRVVFTSSNTSDMKDVIITISDTGHGIRDEDLNRIYDPFFSRKKEGSATGLGLAVAYGIVQQHHGTIVVDTELAKGTSFKMTFPTYNVKEGEHAE